MSSIVATEGLSPTRPAFTCPAGAAFCEASGAAGLDVLTGYGRGANFVDVNGDGWDDLFVADTDPLATSTFYLNRGDGTYTMVDAGLDPLEFIATWGVAFADYDNDGDPDMAVANGGYTQISSLALYENRFNETGQFVSRTIASGVGAADDGQSHWWGVSWADYDQDGWVDFVAVRREGVPLLFHNQGDGTFAEVGESQGVALDCRGKDCKNPVWFDYDGDGDLDLYISGISTHGLFSYDAGGFKDVTSAVLGMHLAPTVAWTFAVAAADFDQNGLDDLYLGRWTEPDYVLLNQGGSKFVRYNLGWEVGLGSTPGCLENTMGLGVGDLHDDGYPDVVIGTGQPEAAAPDVFLCNTRLAGESFGLVRCTDMFTENASGPYLTRGHAPVFADVDHDGDTDLFRNLGGHPTFDAVNPPLDTREENALFLSQGALTNTARLTLEGSKSNRDALGARVRVQGSEEHYYTVRSAQGFQSENSRSLIVSLGTAQQADVLVTWLGGATSGFVIQAGQSARVVEAFPGAIGTLHVEHSSTTPGDLRVSWEGSCSLTADNYAIYEGEIGEYYSHGLKDCFDDGNDFVEEITPEAGNSYYLVVPMSGTREGSYGVATGGGERPVGSPLCAPTQVLGPCP